MTRRWMAGVILSAVTVLGVAACTSVDETPPVATVSVTPSRTRLPLGSPLDFTYRFDVAPTATIPADYRVFLQVKGPDGQLLWQDDHDPPIPTSQWKAGETVEYTRTRFVPVVAYIGDASVEVGLYRGDDRLPLRGPSDAEHENTGRSYRVATLQLQSQSENVFLIFKSGWHPDEFAPDNPETSWKWTQKTAVVSARNPKTDVTVYLEYDARPDMLTPVPQQVTLRVGEQVVHTFAADATAPAILRIPITAAQLGGSDMVDLQLDVDRTFVPAKLAGGNRDDRELGIRVFHFFIEPK